MTIISSGVDIRPLINDLFPGREIRVSTETLEQVLQSLLPRDVKVLTPLYGLDGQGRRTFEEVGQQYNVASTRISRIKGKAFHKLRRDPRRSTLLGEETLP